MKHLKSYSKLFESLDFEPGADLEYIDYLLLDIKEAGYDIQQYFGFKNPKEGELIFKDLSKRSPAYKKYTDNIKHDKLYIVGRNFIDNLISQDNLRRPHMIENNSMYVDYLNGNLSYLIKIYSYLEDKGYNSKFPFGEITYTDVYKPLKQLIEYMSKERGLTYYKISATTDIKRKSEMVPWDFTSTQFNNIDDLKNIKIIGNLNLYISKNNDLIPTK